jgi:integrase
MANTVHGRRGALVRFLKWIDRTAGTSHAQFVPKVTRPAPRTVLCTPTEADRLLQGAPPWFRFFMTLCYKLGLRHDEARLLTPRAWDTTRQTITIRRKGQSVSILPVPPELAPMLDYAATQDPDAPVVSTLGCRYQTQHSLTNWWTKHKRKCGINPDLHVHDLRRTLATALYDQTKDLRAVQQLLGHKHMSSTLLYIAPRDPDYLRSLLAELKPQHIAEMKPATETPQ